MRGTVALPDGTTVRGHYPGTSRCTLTEHYLRDELAHQLHGATEATLPYGRADVMTATAVFEVEHIGNWRAGVRQVLAYSVQCGRAPAVALFGRSDKETLHRLRLRLRDGRPPIALWWYTAYHGDVGPWVEITSRTVCTDARLGLGRWPMVCWLR